MKVCILRPAVDPDADPPTYFIADVSPAWVRAHDNGRLVSCGLTVGYGSFTERHFRSLEARGNLRQVTADEYNQFGTQGAAK